MCACKYLTRVWLSRLKKTRQHFEVGIQPKSSIVLYIGRGKAASLEHSGCLGFPPRTHQSTRLQCTKAVTCHHWPPCPTNRAPHRPRPRPPRLHHSPQRGRRAQHVTGVEARRLAATTDNRVPAAARLVRTASGPVPSTPKGWSYHIHAILCPPFQTPIRTRWRHAAD